MSPQEKALKEVLDELERAERQEGPAEDFAGALAAALIFAELVYEQTPSKHDEGSRLDYKYNPKTGMANIPYQRKYFSTSKPIDHLVDIIFDKHSIDAGRLYRAALGLEALKRDEIAAVAGLAREYLLRHS